MPTLRHRGLRQQIYTNDHPPAHCTYFPQQIADKLGRRAKAIDSGLQRINTKLGKRFRGTGFREDFLTA